MLRHTYLPLILELQSFDSSTKEEVIQNEIKKDVDKFLSPAKKVIPAETVVTEDIASIVDSISDEASQQINNVELIDDILADIEDVETVENVQGPENIDDRSKRDNYQYGAK